jgi:putative ABC transport system permease protein
MKTPLAWRNLLHDKSRTAVGVGGVAFAVFLVLMQLGFLGAVESTATVIYSALEFDLLLRSPEYLHFTKTGEFPALRLRQAASAPGVQSARPMHIAMNRWRAPLDDSKDDGNIRALLMMGVDPVAPVFGRPDIAAEVAKLQRPDYVVIDRKSRSDFGPADQQRFGPADIGRTAELGGRRVEIVGTFELGTGLSADGAVIVSQQGFVRAMPSADPERLSLGMIRLKTPDGHPPDEDQRKQAAEALQAWLDGYDDVQVLTRQEALDYELNYWVKGTSVGAIFTFGAVLGMVVGLAIVYQVQEADVTHHVKEYATMKAMGFGYYNLLGVILKQSIALALMGYVLGLALTVYVGYPITAALSNLTIELAPIWAVVVFAASVGICAASGFLASQKLHSADPASLF